MKSFLISNLTQIATYATIIVIFTHNALFDREVACTCQGQELHCNLYIILPIFIIFLLLLWMDKVFNATFRAYCCVQKRREIQEKFCYLIFLQMGKAAVISLLWVVSVLFDGDWFACCHNGLPEQEAQIPCKKSRTLDEQVIVDDLKNTSKIIGLFILLGLLILVVCFSLLKWCKCCEKCSSCSDCWKKCSDCCSDCCKGCPDCYKFHKDCSCCSESCYKCSRCSDFCNKCSHCSNFREERLSCSDCRKECSSCFNSCKNCSSYSDGDGPYELIIIQEEENVVNQILKERAKKALKQKVEEILKKDETNKYMNCYDAAQQVIDQVWSGQPCEAETHEDVWKLTGNVSVTRSPGKKKEKSPRNEDEWDSSEGGEASASDQPTGSKKVNKAETHEDVWKLTGNVSITPSPGKKGPGPSTSGTASPADLPSGSKKVKRNVSVTRSPGKKKEKSPRNEDEWMELEPLM